MRSAWLLSNFIKRKLKLTESDPYENELLSILIIWMNIKIYYNLEKIIQRLLATDMLYLQMTWNAFDKRRKRHFSDRKKLPNVPHITFEAIRGNFWEERKRQKKMRIQLYHIISFLKCFKPKRCLAVCMFLKCIVCILLSEYFR